MAKLKPLAVETLAVITDGISFLSILQSLPHLTRKEVQQQIAVLIQQEFIRRQTDGTFSRLKTIRPFSSLMAIKVSQADIDAERQLVQRLTKKASVSERE